MMLDELLLEVRARRLMLISEEEVWPSPLYTCRLQRAVRRHRKGLALLLRWSDASVCPSRLLHAPYMRYAGRGRYVCEICERMRSSE